MRVLKYISAIIFLVISFMMVTSPVNAVSTSTYTPTANPVNSPVIVTGYAFSGGQVKYVQLYNSSDKVVDMSNWQLQYILAGQTTAQSLVSLHGLLKPSNYVLAAENSFSVTADFSYTMAAPSTLAAANLQLVPSAQYLTQTITLKGDAPITYWQRNVSTSTGDYLSTFASFTPSATFSLYIGGLYTIPADPLLQISEVLANPRQCSPLETALDCSDYVKLFNPSNQPIDLSQFRLRTGFQGQSASSSNTFSMSGVVAPGHYAVITVSNDGHAVSLTNSGGYIWVEDAYGLQRYESSVQEYADAGSDAKKGQAWAYDSSDGSWKWTTHPTPSDGPSVFPIVIAQPVTTTLAPCKEGQYRSEETNRCRTLAVTVSSTLAPCDEGKERNPATNRCRTVATTAQGLNPCGEGQERNPDTNRCRKVVSTSIPPAAFAVQPVADSRKVFIGWLALGGVVVLGVGYGLWEWRREVVSWVRKIVARLSFSH